MLWLAFAVFLCLAYLWVFVDAALGIPKLTYLFRVPVDLPRPAPKISLLVTALNEERNIRAAMLSLLKQDYPNYEVIAVNDRSTDLTGKILEELARENSKLKVITVKELPPHWLGKNHALFMASTQADGEFLLFCDADVVMTPDALSRVMSYSLANHLDQSTIMPEVTSPSVPLKAFVSAFLVVFVLAFRPWAVKNPKSRAHLGVGAFNLVRKSAYLAVGGHETIRLRPDDDVKLGKILKANGYRCEANPGIGLVSVEWYASLGEGIRGLEKNAFSGFEYNWLYFLLGISALIVVYVMPYVGAVFAPFPAKYLFILASLHAFPLFILAKPSTGVSIWYALLFPFTVMLFWFAIVRACLITLKTGGIRWRGTFYSLRELRSNRVDWKR